MEKLRKTDLAQRYRERLVYVDPFLRKGYTPCINPLQIEGITRENAEIYAQSLEEVFAEMIPDAKLSNYMKAILQPCLTTLLLTKCCSLPDLQAMLQEEDNQRVHLGKQSHIASHKKFFQKEFHHRLYDYTKNSLSTKLQSLLNSPTFHNYTTGQSTINLERCIRQGKIILFNLSKGCMGTQVSTTLGKLLIAKIKGIAFQRASLPPHLHVPMYLVIDEADSFLGGNESLNVILKESRKF